MALQVAPERQRRLLDVAESDRSIAAARHRRDTLPELAVIAEGDSRIAALRSDRIVAETEVSDLQRQGAKLDAEIDQVRARSERDTQRLTSGAGPAKDLTSLQHEIDTLARRQGVLEDQALDLMEQREVADDKLANATRAYDAAVAEVEAARVRLTDQQADLDDELARLDAARAEQVADVPDELLAVYDRVRAAGKVGAAKLIGGQCQACRLTLDTVALGEIRSAAPDAVVRCSECGAILIRD